MENSKIEWCEHSFNPWVGCTKVSPGCDHCYAESWAKRTGQPHLWTGSRRRTRPENWRLPIKWNREAERDRQRIRIFCASSADVFDNQVPWSWRSDLWDLIAATPNLDWLLLTKRPQNMLAMLPWPTFGEPWPNVWLGTTAENQEEMARRRGHLLYVSAAVHFVSCEPLLERVWLPSPDTYWHSLDWVICGGESGPGARPMRVEWARSLRDECAEMGIAFFMKQAGSASGWPGVSGKGSVPTQWPADLRIRQFPERKQKHV